MIVPEGHWNVNKNITENLEWWTIWRGQQIAYDVQRLIFWRSLDNGSRAARSVRFAAHKLLSVQSIGKLFYVIDFRIFWNGNHFACLENSGDSV